MTTYTPHKWVIIEITTPDYSAKKVFAGWHGGFANGDSWRVSSGIVDIDTTDDTYTMKTETGSFYVCYKENEGFSLYMSEVYQTFIDSIDGMGEIKIISSEDFFNKSEAKMTHPFEEVRRFMLAGDQDVTGNDTKLAHLYANLVEEEVAEFWSGTENNDAIETLDGICDAIWVLVGYAHAKGWNVVGAFEEVARSNMSKVDIESGKLLKRADGKILKAEGYFKPNLAPFVRKIGDEPKPENIVMGLGEE